VKAVSRSEVQVYSMHVVDCVLDDVCPFLACLGEAKTDDRQTLCYLAMGQS